MYITLLNIACGTFQAFLLQFELETKRSSQHSKMGNSFFPLSLENNIQKETKFVCIK